MTQTSNSINLVDFIRDVPDFPKPGITFKDITPLLGSHAALTECIDQFVAKYQNEKIDVIAAAEARGFLFAVPLAMRLGVGMVPIRKPGKLPFEKHSYSYDLEYGSDTLEMHVDGIQEGQNVLVIDDLLATGGTLAAAEKLVHRAGGSVVGAVCVIELTGLRGRDKLGCDVAVLQTYAF